MLKKTNWGGGKQTPGIIRSIEAIASVINTGTLLAIDPASKSLGYALYEAGELTSKGKLVSKKRQVNERLHDLHKQLKNKFKSIDILAVEKIRGSMAHDYLKWSIGVAIVSINSDFMIEVPIQFWKKLREDDYTKDDDNDAELIGAVLVRIAEESAIPNKTKRFKKRYK